MSSSTLAPMRRPSGVRVWFVAARPATLTAAVGPVAVGTALAAADGVFQSLPAALALLGALLIQLGTNFFNDYADFLKGADTQERIGPARVTQKGWLTPRAVLSGAIVTFGLAMGCGVYLVVVGGWPVVAIGLTSIACGVLYTGGPRPLGYLGLGDLFVLVFFGIVAVCGTYYVQALTLSAHVIWASIPIGALATAILVVNNLRDRETDVKAHKRTLVVRFGERFGRLEYVVLIVAAYAIPVAMWAAGSVSDGWLLPVLSLPMAAFCVRDVARLDGTSLNPILGSTARLGLLYSLLLAGGIVL